MPESDARFLDTFPRWLASLPKDVQELASLLTDDSQSESVRRCVAGSMNYLFKSLDLIPDGIADLGFIDDAFVLRVASARAKEMGASGDALDRLAEDVVVIREFLGPDHDRLERFVAGLENGLARGRTVENIVGDANVRAALLSDLKGWAAHYEPPAFSHDEKNLIKLRSFLRAKLPA